MKRILVADDDKYFRDEISGSLTDHGYNVTLVTNGKDAMDELAEENYDAAVLDMYMDKVNGIQVIAAIKEISPKFPIIVITGDNSIELEREIRSRGVFYYFIKPFDMKELNEVLESAFKSSGTKKS